MRRRTFRFFRMLVLLALPCAALAAPGGGEHTQEIEALERAAFDSPDNPTLQGELADAYYRIYQSTKDHVYEQLSIAQYEKFLSLQPAHDGARLALYTLYYGRLLNAPQPGLMPYMKKLFEGMSDDFRKELMPPSTMEAVSLATAQERDPSVKVENERLTSLLKSGIRENPRHNLAYFILARSYRLNREYDSEIAVLKQAMFMLPKDAEVGKRLAHALDDKLGRAECYVTDPYLLDDALQAWQRILPSLPDDPEVHRMLLLKYELKGLYDLQLFEARALYKLTNSAGDRLLLADSLLSAGYLQEALDVYEAMGKKGSALNALKENMAMAYFYQRKLDKAAKQFSAYVRADSGDFYARITYALVESARGNHERARDSLRDFLKSKDREYTPWMAKLGDYFFGLVTAKELVDAAKNPCEETEAFYYIGMQHMNRGDFASARDHFNKVVALKVHGYREYIGAAYALRNLETAQPVP